jgi:sirohydrochlorin cobaltochelatase
VVDLAFLEFMTPTLAESANAVIAAGVTKVVVMPMFIAQGGHLKRELPEMLAALRSEHPQVEFVLGGAIGENEIVVQAMAEAAIHTSGAKLA